MKCTAGKETLLGVTGDHDWVLTPREYPEKEKGKPNLFWACPCGEFKWTSYAEWEGRQGDKNGRERDAIFGDDAKHTGKPGAFEAHTT